MNKIPKIDLVYVLRYWLGFMMMYHSYGMFLEAEAWQGFANYLDKQHIPFPKVMALVAKSCEFLGGLLLVLGLWTRWAALMILLVMSVAAFYMHRGIIWGEGELAFNYWLMALILFFNPDIPFQIFKSKPSNPA